MNAPPLNPDVRLNNLAPSLPVPTGMAINRTIATAVCECPRRPAPDDQAIEVLSIHYINTQKTRQYKIGNPFVDCANKSAVPWDIPAPRT